MSRSPTTSAPPTKPGFALGGGGNPSSLKVSDTNLSVSGDGELRTASGGGGAEFNASGRYQVLDKLGSGGMGTVVKALDMRLGRFVALKRANVPGNQVTPAQVEGFLREARVLAQLRHFNLPEIYDIDTDENGPFISMEFIEGRTLLAEHQARGGYMDPRLVIEIGEAVCGALTTVHRKGIVHRDIKPSNILLTADGVSKLIDFGIAAAGLDAAGNSLSVESTVAGTRSYSSPEQLADATKADARSDVYSLGATLYALLTGSSPVEFKETLLPAPLRGTIRQAMHREPGKRFQTAEEFRRALQALSEVALDQGSAVASAPEKVAAADRPLLDRLKDEVRAHQNEGRYQEAITVWQRVGKITGKPEAVAPAIERCQARLREREGRRLLEKLGEQVTAGRLADAENTLRELASKFPGNPEAAVWRQTLIERRKQGVKKLYFDAKAYLHDHQLESALECLNKALQQNLDPALGQRIEKLAGTTRARLALERADKLLRHNDDPKAALEQVQAARAFLTDTPGLADSDPLWAEIAKRSGQLAGSETIHTDRLLRWVYLTAAAPGLATMTVGPLFFGGLAAGIGLGLVALGTGGVFAVVGRSAQAGGQTKKSGFAARLDDLVEPQRESGLMTKIALGAVAVSAVVVVVIGLLRKGL